ncbi:MAG: RsmE family RNA methyltransferase [Actinomycetota bacterium]
MRHVPHCFVPAPWTDDRLALGEATVRHLERVLRLAPGDPVSYTDGSGTIGSGPWAAPFIERGAEDSTPRGSHEVTIAVAPPKGSDRQRFVVEKLAELGVARLIWISTRYGDAKSPKPAKAATWAIGALEQSRGAWLLDIGGPMGLADVPGDMAIADPAGERIGSGPSVDTIAIGPAGGWHPDELAEASMTVTLGDRILRTETAAIVAATLAAHR